MLAMYEIYTALHLILDKYDTNDFVHIVSSMVIQVLKY